MALKWFRKKEEDEPADEPMRSFPWGGLDIPEDQLEPHFAVLGMTNSAKTLTIRMLMRAALVEEDPRTGATRLKCRAVVYDPKGEFYPLLVGMGVPAASIRVLHPFDTRSWAWNLAADVRDSSSAWQLASILAPTEDKSTQPFFSNATQDIVAGVLEVFRERGVDWTLNDVVEVATQPDRLREVLALSREGSELLQVYFHNDQTWGNIISTIRTKITPYRTVARLWSRCDTTRRVSLAQWVNDPTPSVLLLGTDDSNRAALDAINHAMFKRTSELLTSRPAARHDDPKTSHNETWVFLDELRMAGSLDGLQSLLLKGRTMGVRVVIGFQDIQGLIHVYGQQQADELVGQCGNVAVLRLNNPSTMKWASTLFANYEEYTPGYSTSHSSGAGGGSTSISTSWNLQQRQAMLEQEFRLFPRPTPESGITGAYIASNKAWRDVTPPAFVSNYLMDPSDRLEDIGFSPRPPSEQERRPWDNSDRQRFGLSVRPEDPKVTPPGQSDSVLHTM